MSASTLPTGDTVTRLLHAYNAGDRQAMQRLMDLVYTELLTVGRRYLNRERPGHTLDTRALVHEAYARLVGGRTVSWKNRKHFYVIFARAMRRILCDHARRHGAAKRGGGAALLTLTMLSQLHPDDTLSVEERTHLHLSIDQALDRLEAVDVHLAEVVHLRYYQGMTIADTARIMGRSARSVKRDWHVARHLLHHYLGRSLLDD